MRKWDKTIRYSQNTIQHNIMQYITYIHLCLILETDISCLSATFSSIFHLLHQVLQASPVQRCWSPAATERPGSLRTSRGCPRHKSSRASFAAMFGESGIQLANLAFFFFVLLYWDLLRYDAMLLSKERLQIDTFVDGWYTEDQKQPGATSKSM